MLNTCDSAIDDADAGQGAERSKDGGGERNSDKHIAEEIARAEAALRRQAPKLPTVKWYSIW